MPDLSLQDDAAVAAPALGPGDADPRSPVVVTASEARPALGPGDDDPRSPVRGEIATAAPAKGPGDGPPATHRAVTPGPASPGGTDTGPRHLTLVPLQAEE